MESLGLQRWKKKRIAGVSNVLIKVAEISLIIYYSRINENIWSSIPSKNGIGLPLFAVKIKDVVFCPGSLYKFIESPLGQTWFYKI